MKLFFVALFGTVLLTILVTQPSFAQQSSNNTAPIYQNNTTLKAPQSSVPVLEKLTDKGMYRVQLKWDSTSLNPNGEFDMQVLFLNASSPHSNSTNVPQRESNYTGYSVGPNKTAGVDTSIIDSPIPVDHYDVAIYDNSGHVLYSKVDQPGQASAGGITVSLGNYTGGVTIAITNITAAAPLGSTSSASNNPAPTDSVKFSATVAPEFPIAPLVLVGALSSAIAVWRLKRRTSSIT
jgi:hypothetical protein